MKEFKVIVENDTQCNNECCGLVKIPSGYICAVYENERLSWFEEKFIAGNGVSRCQSCLECFGDGE
jgi:hypothetical protein